MNTRHELVGEQVRILYRQSRLLLLIILLLVVVVVGFFRDHEDTDWLSGWALAVVALTVLRVALVRQFHLRAPRTGLRAWGNLFALSSLLSGISWGVLPLFIVDIGQGQDVLLLTIILTGMVAGSLVSLTSYLPAYFAFSIPTIVPLALVLMNESDPVYALIGSMILLFLLSMLGFSFNVNRSIADSIRLRFENLDLMQNLREQKEVAEQASRDKSRFLAATSHDLRQPMHALNLFLEAARQNIDEPVQLSMLLDKAMASCYSLSELFNALMDISRMDAGSVSTSPRLLDLGTLVTRVVAEFEHIVSQRGIRIETTLDEVLVCQDAVLLERMIRNLISNAVEHSGARTIRIETRREGRRVGLAVCDDGRGIDPAELDNIFTEFYQLDNPERDRGKGLGLGLAIVRRLSGLTGIRVEAWSRPGEGARFSLFMDVDDSDMSLLAPAEDLQQTDLTGVFVVVIDDEATVRDAIRSLLRGWGCEILLADSGQAMLQELEREQYPAPDLIISDYRLREGRNGIQAVEALRTFFGTALPAILVTGDSSQQLVREAAQAGCRLLLKPLGGDNLRREIVATLGA